MEKNYNLKYGPPPFSNDEVKGICTFDLHFIKIMTNDDEVHEFAFTQKDKRKEYLETIDKEKWGYVGE